MNARRDALATANWRLKSAPSPAGHPDAVCTRAASRPSPASSPLFAGRAEATLDQRDLDAAVLARMYGEASERFASEEGCTVEWSKIWSIEPIRFDRDLIGFCMKVIKEAADDFAYLPSAPLHDTAEVARAGIPAVMTFVQSLGGISHNKIEDTKEEHLELAVIAKDRLAGYAAQWISRK
jgi:beta-ureidopropionase / N-carbamoyl-L-amino-acid hydrolase